MNLLLDTNAYTALASGDRKILKRLSATPRLLMSVVVVGELEYGFRYGSRYEENRRSLEAFLNEPYVEYLTLSRETTLRYGALCAELRRAGRTIPSNDAWIAAQALEHGAELLTRDSHFGNVAGILVSTW